MFASRILIEQWPKWATGDLFQNTISAEDFICQAFFPFQALALQIQALKYSSQWKIMSVMQDVATVTSQLLLHRARRCIGYNRKYPNLETSGNF